MTSQNSQNRVSWQVAFGEAPRKGSKSMYQLLDFSVSSPIGIDLSYEEQSVRLEFVQSIYIDNSANPASISATMLTTSQVITCPSYSQGYFPVLSSLDNTKISFSTTDTPRVPVEFLNFPVPLMIWSVLGNTIIPPVVTQKFGQVKIALTGTAVQVSPTSYILQNGVIVAAALGNNATGGTIGLSGLTNTVDGTGNGSILSPGQPTSIGSGVNINSIYVNGTAGDIFTFIGS